MTSEWKEWGHTVWGSVTTFLCNGRSSHATDSRSLGLRTWQIFSYPPPARNCQPSATVLIITFCYCNRRSDSVIGIMTGLHSGRPRTHGSIPPAGKTFIYHTKHTDRLWGPPKLLCPGYWGVLPPGVKQTGRESANLHLVPRSRISKVMPLLPHMPSKRA